MAGRPVSKRAFLFLVLIVQLAIGLSLPSRASSAFLAFSVAPPAVAGAADADRECPEPGTCVDDSASRGGSFWSRWWPWRGRDGTDGAPTPADEGGGPVPSPGPALDDGERLIGHEELARHIGEDGSPIWLSILGQVFDVSAGEAFYSKKDGSYSFYAGRDASACFSSGKNNAEGAAERLEEWEDDQLAAVWEWATFYHEHATYKYLGVLAGSRYYDEAGNESELRKDIAKRAGKAMLEAQEAKKKKRLERQAARERRKKK